MSYAELRLGRLLWFPDRHYSSRLRARHPIRQEGTVTLQQGASFLRVYRGTGWSNQYLCTLDTGRDFTYTGLRNGDLGLRFVRRVP